MRIVLTKTGSFFGRMTLQIIPSVTASVVGGYLLAQLVPQQQAATPAPTETAKAVAVKAKGAALANDQAPIRVVPLPRKEGQASEPPAEVKRAEMKPQEGKPVEAKSSEVKSVEAKQVASLPAVPEAKTPRAKTAASSPAAASMQVYTPEPYTPEADLPQVAAQPVLAAPPAQRNIAPAAPSVVASTTPALVQTPAPAAAPALPPPTVLAPVTVTAPRTVAALPPAQELDEDAPAKKPAAERSTGEHVFSAISNAAGTAANVTGDTINWVIDLPGKLIGRDGQQQQPPQQQASQPRRLM